MRGRAGLCAGGAASARPASCRSRRLASSRSKRRAPWSAGPPGSRMAPRASAWRLDIAPVDGEGRGELGGGEEAGGSVDLALQDNAGEVSQVCPNVAADRRAQPLNVGAGKRRRGFLDPPRISSRSARRLRWRTAGHRNGSLAWGSGGAPCRSWPSRQLTIVRRGV